MAARPGVSPIEISPNTLAPSSKLRSSSLTVATARVPTTAPRTLREPPTTSMVIVVTEAAK